PGPARRRRRGARRSAGRRRPAQPARRRAARPRPRGRRGDAPRGGAPRRDRARRGERPRAGECAGRGRRARRRRGARARARKPDLKRARIRTAGRPGRGLRDPQRQRRAPHRDRRRAGHPARPRGGGDDPVLARRRRPGAAGVRSRPGTRAGDGGAPRRPPRDRRAALLHRPPGSQTPFRGSGYNCGGRTWRERSMNILRRATTRQLVIAIVVLVALAAGSAVALAGGDGPKPPHRSLAAALHEAATARPVPGVTARVQFANHLVANDSLGAGSPLITGATGRIWAGDGKVRLELQSSAGDTEIGFDGARATLYDVSSGTAYVMPVRSRHHGDSAATHHHAVPSIAQIQRALTRAARHADLSGAIPGDIAGRPAYTVRVSPRHSGGLLGSVQLAWDAAHGIPLRIAIYSRTDSSPVLSLTVTDISYGAVSSSDLAVHLAPGTKIVRVHPPQ